MMGGRPANSAPTFEMSDFYESSIEKLQNAKAENDDATHDNALSEKLSMKKQAAQAMVTYQETVISSEVKKQAVNDKLADLIQSVVASTKDELTRAYLEEAHKEAKAKLEAMIATEKAKVEAVIRKEQTPIIVAALRLELAKKVELELKEEMRSDPDLQLQAMKDIRDQLMDELAEGRRVEKLASVQATQNDIDDEEPTQAGASPSVEHEVKATKEETVNDQTAAPHDPAKTVQALPQTPSLTKPNPEVLSISSDDDEAIYQTPMTAAAPAFGRASRSAPPEYGYLNQYTKQPSSARAGSKRPLTSEESLGHASKRMRDEDYESVGEYAECYWDDGDNGDGYGVDVYKNDPNEQLMEHEQIYGAPPRTYSQPGLDQVSGHRVSIYDDGNGSVESYYTDDSEMSEEYDVVGGRPEEDEDEDEGDDEEYDEEDEENFAEGEEYEEEYEGEYVGGSKDNAITIGSGSEEEDEYDETLVENVGGTGHLKIEEV